MIATIYWIHIFEPPCMQTFA